MEKYALYIKERENAELYDCQEGFFTYKVTDNIFFIDNLFVLPEYRLKGIGRKLSDKMDELAKEHKCPLLMCTVSMDAEQPFDSAKFIKKMGYKYETFDDKKNLMYFKKVI